MSVAAILVVACVVLTSTLATAFTTTGESVPDKASFDRAMRTFMERNGIRAGQLAFGHDGIVTFSHAYTNADAPFPTTQPTTIFRVSSISKALETASMDKLFADGSVKPSTRVYDYLGISSPLLDSQHPDPRAGSITVQELIDHTAGFHNDDGTAPEFNMRRIERDDHLDRPLTSEEFARYLYGQPLGSKPGATVLYSNEDYFLLMLVIEKATSSPYLPWVDDHVLAPIGIDDDVMTATRESGRRPNEAICDDPATGLSVLEPQKNIVLPACYGGGLDYETIGAPTSISISAQSLVKFLAYHDAYGLGPRSPGSSRYGSLDGSYAWMESLSDGTDFAFTFNSRDDRSGTQFDSKSLTEFLEKHL